MKKIMIALCMLCILLTACTPEKKKESKQYTATFLEIFDTVTTIVGRAESEEAFHKKAQAVYDSLGVYHRLFDIYESYEGMNNLKTVNDMAGIAPVTVDPAIIMLLKDCKEYAEVTEGDVNAALGSVLRLWHTARTDSLNNPQNAYLPEREALWEASKHADFASVEIDENALTVFLKDPYMRLDVGAVAKGWAVQKVCENAPDGLLVSVGGNVCATGPKDENGTRWVIGIADPDGDGNLHTIYLSKGSVVTSGDYQRAYMADGKIYHHIIDPETLYPSGYWRSVTIVAQDSGLADALSTALFVRTKAEGERLLSKYGADAMWVSKEGDVFMTAGFEAMIRT